MPYELFTDVQSKNYYNPAQCLTHYGMSRTIGGYTIHHWGTPHTGLTWDGIRRYLSREGGNTSAHYVVDAGKVARIVPDENAAWHAGSAVGNARTIGIEVNPDGGDAVYQTVAELLRDLWNEHVIGPVYPHNHWSATSCPGDLDYKRMEQMAHDLLATPVSNPIPRPDPVSAPQPAMEYSMDKLDLRNAQNVPVRGRHVDNLQGLLLAAGYGPQGLIGSNGRPDGVAGQATKAFVGAWQIKTNTGDGQGHADYIVGNGTWKSLIEY